MKNFPTLVRNKEGKPKDQGLNFLIVTLNMLYPYREGLNNLIIMNY